MDRSVDRGLRITVLTDIMAFSPAVPPGINGCFLFSSGTTGDWVSVPFRKGVKTNVGYTLRFVTTGYYKDSGRSLGKRNVWPVSPRHEFCTPVLTRFT
ncbi:hypothetical protein TNCV_1216811 [Trichonephila clavipes]|nr:hypothetical protein TNCV_1216811 [Trichonephila clavipes]